MCRCNQTSNDVSNCWCLFQACPPLTWYPGYAMHFEPHATHNCKPVDADKHTVVLKLSSAGFLLGSLLGTMRLQPPQCSTERRGHQHLLAMRCRSGPYL